VRLSSTATVAGSAGSPRVGEFRIAAQRVGRSVGYGVTLAERTDMSRVQRGMPDVALYIALCYFAEGDDIVTTVSISWSFWRNRRIYVREFL
jgi:hypothetical protein